MFTFIITAAIFAAFTTAVVVFFNAFMDFFDLVVQGIKALFRAIKVMIMNKEGKVEAAVLTENENGSMAIVRDTTQVEPVDANEIMKNDDLRAAFERAVPIGKKNEKIIAVNDDQVRQIIA